ncbi:MAG: zinc carboxypeptidase [Bdellovibrionales bacterium]|nr:zinc carboxypeptidase [Bdellovibrionales bacterium]
MSYFSHGAAALVLALLGLSAGISSPVLAHGEGESADRFIQVMVEGKEARSKTADLGLSIEFVRSDSVWGFASPSVIADLKAAGLRIAGNFDVATARGGHQGVFDFPAADARFHNYAELTQKLNSIANANADIARVVSIGKSLQGRELLAIHINTDTVALDSGKSEKPGIVYMGTHHAREHLSTEIPLMFAEHLLKNRADAQISGMLNGRDIWIVPMVNPDGVEYDIETTSYRMWRKNRRANEGGTFGVDLNRNYGYMWGTGGSSTNPSSDTYMGTEPFSEPETAAVKGFLDTHRNLTIVLSVHTFSELILYPWGHKYDAIETERDRLVHEKMAQTMAAWNGYTPQQSSDLYIASGDTTDYAYGELGMISFTFELSPKSMWNGGFYPGAGVIDRVFEANLRPFLYALDLSNDPYRVLSGGVRDGFLKSYKLPQVPAAGPMAAL